MRLTATDAIPSTTNLAINLKNTLQFKTHMI
jgi:hypothetical protein